MVEPEYFKPTEPLLSLFPHLFFHELFQNMVSRIQVSFNSKRRDAFRYKIHRKVQSTARAMSFPVKKKPFTFKKQEITFQIQDANSSQCDNFEMSNWWSAKLHVINDITWVQASQLIECAPLDATIHDLMFA